MKKRESKREENAYKTLNEIVDRLDSYEEIYPDRELEENQKMEEEAGNRLVAVADLFIQTDLSNHILNVLRIESDMRENGMLTEEDLMEALDVRDRLYLMSHAGVSMEAELGAEVQLQFYQERRESLLSALTKNNRAACLSDTQKSRNHAERNDRKMRIYLRVIENNIKRLEAEQIG